MRDLQWRSDLWTEETLDAIGLPYVLQDVDLADIDWTASAHNGARLDRSIVVTVHTLAVNDRAGWPARWAWTVAVR